MTVTEYADILRNPELTFYEDGSYTSHTTQKEGYRATFQLAQKWFWYSVSDTRRKVSRIEVADAITRGEVERSGRYKSDGFEATVRYEGHSYMIGMDSKHPVQVRRLVLRDKSSDVPR